MFFVLLFVTINVNNIFISLYSFFSVNAFDIIFSRMIGHEYYQNFISFLHEMSQNKFIHLFYYFFGSIIFYLTSFLLILKKLFSIGKKESEKETKEAYKNYVNSQKYIFDHPTIRNPLL